MTQEVAYNTLLVRRRAELHRRVAAAMEKVLGDQLADFTPALAHHYLLGEDPEKAAAYSWKAAQSAIAIHAHVEAIRLAEQALELYEKLGKVAGAVDASYLIGRVRRYRGETDLALGAYERALGLLETSGAGAPEIARLIATMAELCTRWDAKHSDLAGLIAKGLASPGVSATGSLAARLFGSRNDHPTEESLRTQEALAISLRLLRGLAHLDAVGTRSATGARFAHAAHRRRSPAESLQTRRDHRRPTMVSQAALVRATCERSSTP